MIIFDEILLTQLALLVMVNNNQLIDNTRWETSILTLLPILLIPCIPLPSLLHPREIHMAGCTCQLAFVTRGGMDLTLEPACNLVFKLLSSHQFPILPLSQLTH